MITTSTYDDPVYFNCYPNITLALDDPNIVKGLTLNIFTFGYNMEGGSKPFALIYRIYYRLLGTQLNLGARINRKPAGKTMLIQCSTPDAKTHVQKMIQWQDINLPKQWLLEQESPPAKPVFDELDLTHIQQCLDGTIKICFHDNQPLKINEGRHSFAGSESISKRDQDLNEFLQKNLEKPTNLKLKGASSNKSQVSTAFYSTKPETSSPCSRIAIEEEEEEVKPPVSPSFSDFQTNVEAPVFESQLRVLNVLNEIFEIDMVSLYNEFISAKNRAKRKYYQSTFAQSEKACVKRKWKETINQLKKHILFFDFLENYYVSKHHLNVIKKSNFVEEDKTIFRSNHLPLETVLITCKMTEVRASPFKFADDQTPIISLIEQNNFTNESLHVIGQQLDRIEEKIDEKTDVLKLVKPLIDLPNQREKVKFKTSQAKTLDIVEKMLADLKFKTKGTSTSATQIISRNEKEIVSKENTNSGSLSSISTKKVFDDQLLEIKRFVGNSKPMSFTKNWYSKLTPP